MALASPVGIDIGGTGIKAGPVDLVRGTLTAERERVETPRPATPTAIVDSVRGVVGRLGAAGGFGITLPSVVVQGVVKTASNIDATWIGTDAVALFSEALERPCGVINDADAAGMAEVRFGAGKGNRGTVILITLGTGIGSGLFFDGVLVPNAELGHLHLHHGDAEDWAAESARERDQLSWKAWGKRISAYLELVESLLWPDLFVIGGGVSRQADKFLPFVECRTPVVPAVLHNDAGIVGAAMVAPLAR
ncbi:MAG TPA: ROK family protein [Acidimicrobiales bacterium]|jgi:polyphosphate glucokinase|nr:ROK family protein [Acidimicrobiales bacterium]